MAQGNGQPLEPWFLELVEEIRNWHHEALKTGGADGEHTARLHASVGRAFQSAFGRPAYATDVDKAGALFHGLVCNHPFVDGNKRTAVARRYCSWYRVVAYRVPHRASRYACSASSRSKPRLPKLP
ncbi:MAG: hypothetical protein EPO22_06795 [Dehalococcoidia bacterium]|nr:MAG: hypothetical protein EPO22_06795 [Dehalococcoidia bacterium]